MEKRGIRRDIGTRIAAQLFNCIEDGRIEKRLVNTYDVRHKFWLKNGTVWQLNDTKPESELQTFLNAVVSIAVTGLYPKYWKTLEGREVYDEVKKIRPHILKAIDSPTCKICARRTEEIYDMVEDFLIKLLEEDQRKLEDFEEMIQQMSEKPDFFDTEEQESGEIEGAISSHLPSKESSEGSEGSGSGTGSEAGEDEEEGESDGSPSGDEAQRGTSQGTKQEIPDTPDEEAIKKALEEALERGKEEATSKLAENPKKKNVEEDQSSLTSEEILEIKKGFYESERLNNYRQDPRTCHLIPLPQALRKQANEFRREVEKFFKTQGLNLHRMDSGRLTSKHLYKIGMGEYNIFTKLGHKSQTDAVVMIVWDGSGSMYGSKQIHSANACAVIEEGLKGLVPVKIVNFSVDWGANQVVHYLVKDFDENSKQHNYSMSYSKSKGFGGGNKDGYSIRVATQELMKRPEKDKILIVMSDGLPSDYNSSRVAIEDTKEAVKDARKKGIYLVSMFFGNERFREAEAESYQYMYQKNLINSAPEDLPKKLVNTLKKLVLR